MSFRAGWEQASQSGSLPQCTDTDQQTSLPDSVRTVRILFETQGYSCCLAVNPVQDGRSVVLDQLPAGEAAVEVAGFHTDFAPVATTLPTCVTAPAGIGEACVSGQRVTPSFRSTSVATTLNPNVENQVGFICMRSQPFLLDLTPSPGGNVSSPVEARVVAANLRPGNDIESVVFEIAGEAAPAILEPCSDEEDDEIPSCSTGGSLDVDGFRVVRAPDTVSPGTVTARVQAQNLGGQSLDFPYTLEAAGAQVDVSCGTVSQEGPVEIATTLTANGQPVVATQNDILFDNTALSLEESDCTINPALDESQPECVGCKSLSVAIDQCGGETQPDGCPPNASEGISRLRGIVVSFENSDEIPDGVLYTCEFGVRPAATIPTLLSNVNVVVSDAEGAALPAFNTDGCVQTSAPPVTPTPTITPTPTTTGGPGVISGTVVNCLDGEPLANAQVTLTATGFETRETSSDSIGDFVFEDLPFGMFRLRGTLAEFIPAEIDVPLDSLDPSRDVTLALCPFEPGLRVVLTWGSSPPAPPDLDSHLWGPAPDVFVADLPVEYHVSFQRPIFQFANGAVSQLDLDDQSFSGPETVSVTELVPGQQYRYCVQDFSNIDNPGAFGLDQSDARVQVLLDGEQIGDFSVPSGPGNVWEVFRLDTVSGAPVVVPVNVLGDEGNPNLVCPRADDIDGDGLTGVQESALGTDVELFDTNSNGLSDGEDVIFPGGLQTPIPTSTPVPSATETVSATPTPTPSPTGTTTSDGVVSGTVVNCLTAQPLAEAQVTLTGPDTEGREMSSDSAGRFLFEDLPLSSFRLRGTLAGFILAEVDVSLDPLNRSRDATLALCPTTDDDLRIVLTWGSIPPAPADLDAHLWGPAPNVVVADLPVEYHVYFVRVGFEFANGAVSQLDIDDLDFSGPETITVTGLELGEYRFCVRDFSNSGNPGALGLQQSGARVQVFLGQQQIGDFSVPSGAGNVWEVFRLDARSPTPVVVPVNVLGDAVNEDVVCHRAGDLDGDGLTDVQELAVGTNPELVDTNGNGLSDGEDAIGLGVAAQGGQ